MPISKKQILSWFEKGTQPKRAVILAGLFVPLIAWAVFCIQLSLVEAYGLSRWKGGGFGMFSTFSNRYLKVDVQVDGRWKRVVGFYHKRRESALRIFPSEKNFQALVEDLKRREWVKYGEKGVLLQRKRRKWRGILWKTIQKGDVNKLSWRETKDHGLEGYTRSEYSQDLSHSHKSRARSRKRILKVDEVQVELWEATYNSEEVELESRLLRYWSSLPPPSRPETRRPSGGSGGDP